ncbi:MAG: ATP-binding protein [Lentisphaeria bacterium]|jgi:signal transduction histidine kinase|nr:ATP-binding protein [Lentisphaeria bacterium]
MKTSSPIAPPAAAAAPEDREARLATVILMLGLILAGTCVLQWQERHFFVLFGANVAFASCILTLVMFHRWHDWDVMPLALLFFWVAMQQFLQALVDLNWLSPNPVLNWLHDYPWFIPTLLGFAATVYLWQVFAARARMAAREAQVKEALQQTQKLESLGIMAAGMAHQFNNILTTISGNVALLGYDIPADSPMQGSITSINDAVQRAARISQQIRDYAGGGACHVAPLDLATVISEMRELLGSSTRSAVKVEFDFEPRVPRIVGDPSQMHQLAANLIINASEAIAPKAGRIAIGIRQTTLETDALTDTVTARPIPPGTYVELCVADTGTGMEPKSVRRMFDPFVTTRGLGRGLGLAAVTGIVHAHEAFLNVKTAPGEGTTVRVFFPPQGERQAPPAIIG